MPDGTLLLPLAGQENDDYNGFDEPIASFLMRSQDRGETWKFHAIIALGLSDYDEPAMVSLGGQRLLCALRSHKAPRQDPPGGYIHMTISEDGGANWSEPRVTSMWGHPASLLRLVDGRILCTYGYRMHPNPGVRACLSEDGVSWKPGDIFTVSAQPHVESDQLQIGCPSSVELESGNVLTAYQALAIAHEPEQSAKLYLEGTSYRV
jgi:hypothetical protein